MTVLRGVRAHLIPPLILIGIGLGCAARPIEGSAWPRSASVFALPFDWTDEQGAAVKFSKWRGQPLVLTMFYRSCQRLCPLTVSEMRRVAAALAERSVAATFVLVTLDPSNDTNARLAQFKASRGLPEASWHLLRGDRSETLALAHLLGIHVTYADDHIDHDVRVLVFDAEGHRLHEYAGWHFDDDPLAP